MNNIIKDFVQNINYKNTLKSMTFNFNYLNDKDSGYRIYVTTNDDISDSVYQNIIIISAFGFINPRCKVDEIYTNVGKLAQFLDVNINNLFIFLDLLELSGIKEKHLFEWTFIEQDDKIFDSIKEIIYYDISSEKNRIICDYEYITRSLIYNPYLNSKKIIDIMSFALKDRCNDDISFEHMIKNFKISLKKVQEEKAFDKYNNCQIL